jgi:hypothetical protein
VACFTTDERATFSSFTVMENLPCMRDAAQKENRNRAIKFVLILIDKGIEAIRSVAWIEMEFMGNTVPLAGLALCPQFRVLLSCRSASSFFISTTAILLCSSKGRSNSRKLGQSSRCNSGGIYRRTQRKAAKNVAEFSWFMINKEIPDGSARYTPCARLH